MNGVTKNDLSADETKLDYMALITIANIAVGRCMENVTSYNAKISEACFSRDITAIHMNGQRLSGEAKRLETATDVLATLLGGLTRTGLEVVNKPWIFEYPDRLNKEGK